MWAKVEGREGGESYFIGRRPDCHMEMLDGLVN